MSVQLIFLFALDFYACFAATFLFIVNRRLHRESRRAVPGYPHPGPSLHPVLGAVDPEPEPRAGTGEDPGADPRVVAEPIRAWKTAKVQRHSDGKLSFRGIYGRSYGVEATAACRAHEGALIPRMPATHLAPAEDCTCGFYALKEAPTFWIGQALLEVELYGKVIPHEKGYRAEKQRVLSVTVYPQCSTLELVLSSEATAAGKMAGEMREVACHNIAEYERNGQLLCARHAVESGKRFFPWTPEPVNCETEWRWAT